MTRINFLSKEDMAAIHFASLEVLEKTGVLVKNESARSLLKEAGCSIESDLVQFPPSLVEGCLQKPPQSFELFSRDGDSSYPVGMDNVIYNPGSSVTYFMDRETRGMRRGTTTDLEQLVRLVDALDHIQAQSTAMIPSDIPEITADFYRHYLVLKNSTKPVISGAFRKEGVHDILRLLEVIAGGAEELTKKPRAILDCCPSSPLIWSEEASQNLMDCANHGIPASIVPAPLIGATSPVTIKGTVIQINAEILSGIVISQLTKPGSPILYGGAPSSFDQRYTTPRYGAIEALITACTFAEMGKHYGVPTQAYLGLSDSKTEDAQTGFESGLGIVLGAMARINVVSGPGALAYINLQSLEKLVIDNELCGAAFRLTRDPSPEDTTVLTELISKVGPAGNFLGQRHTARNLRGEHFMPSDVIDRLTPEAWIDSGSKTTIERAKEKVNLILKSHSPTPLPQATEVELDNTFRSLLKQYES
ncbi:MAG: trimethylamine methyltransferase family protein [Candidatus Thorarchaeota archaeon]|jgi:trimethylamine--corrinoid protein Co-methyltransferase